MGNSILNYTVQEEYLCYLEELDTDALLCEYYACQRLKKAVMARAERVCHTVFNRYCSLLLDICRESVTRHDYYLIRFLLRFELFVKRQHQHINELHDFYDPRPLRTALPSVALTPSLVWNVYLDVMKEFHRFERMIAAFEEKTNCWMYFLYQRRDIPEALKTEECRERMCALKSDGSYDFQYQFEFVYKELVRIIETEMNCDILQFKDRTAK